MPTKAENASRKRQEKSKQSYRNQPGFHRSKVQHAEDRLSQRGSDCEKVRITGIDDLILVADRSKGGMIGSRCCFHVALQPKTVLRKSKEAAITEDTDWSIRMTFDRVAD